MLWLLVSALTWRIATPIDGDAGRLAAPSVVYDSIRWRTSFHIRDQMSNVTAAYAFTPVHQQQPFLLPTSAPLPTWMVDAPPVLAGACADKMHVHTT